MRLSARASAPVHGGIDHQEVRSLGLDPASVVDFSSNLNPFFPSSKLLSGACAGAGEYPDAQYSELRGVIAAVHGVSPDCVFAGNGVSEIVHILCRCLPVGGSVLIPVPTFSEYERAAVICGARTILCRTDDTLRFDPAFIASEIRRESPDLVFLCNPNNPTGLYLSRPEVEEIASAADSVFVIDESYADFVQNPWDSAPLAGSGNVVILRSLAKFYGLAGIRVGYAISNPHVISVLNAARPPWNVNSVACRAARAVFELSPSALFESKSRLFAARDFLVDALAATGKPCLPTDTGFFLVKTPDARLLRDGLLKKGLAVRDCSSFGLASHIRLSARPQKDCERLVKEWTEIDREG
ncbi:MAG: aminotransferase class I/II-fold pyridoxal phosphate-dependent enzyme [Candidatus Mycalebacterium zealandia]|nr:MAG: aminotransferase class I/II-fold pyridoxal phosphate-dependent enzyme [Candidatus Mycalebacterium zealandia]